MRRAGRRRWRQPTCAVPVSAAASPAGTGIHRATARSLALQEMLANAPPLLADALPQPPKLRPDLFAAEFPLEPDDRVERGVGTQTRQALRVSCARALRLDRRCLR